MIYISSTSVYGQSDGEWINEASGAGQLSRKIAGRAACGKAEDSWHLGVEGRGIAGFEQFYDSRGIYGPGRLLSKVATLRNSEPLAGNPEAWLNLVHVEDAAEAVVAGVVEWRGSSAR